MKLSSGTTGVDTSSDAEVTLISAATFRASGGAPSHVRVVNGGSVDGFYSLDGGNVWCRLPASQTTTIYDAHPIKSVTVKRVAGGSNVTSLYADVW